jgi:hypothetical protein
MNEEKSEHIIRQEHFVAGVETGIESERKRIVTQLEELLADDSVSIWGVLGNSQRVSKEQLLSIIKGEPV